MLTAQTTNDDKDALDIDLDVLGILKRRYSLIALGIFIGVTLATVYYFQETPTYESELSVLVGMRSSELTSTGTGRFVEGATSIQEEILSTHMELFGSRKIVESAMQDAGVTLELEDVLDALEISKGGKGLAKNASVLKASFRDPDPELAARLLDAIYTEYRKYIDNQSRDVGADAVKLITAAQKDNEDALRKADQEYHEFIASVPALVSKRDNGRDEIQDVHRMRLINIEKELADVQAALAESRSRKAVIQDFVKDRNPTDLTIIEVLSLLSEKEVSRLIAFVDVTTNRGVESAEEQTSRAITTESARAQYQRLLDLTSKEKVLHERYGTGHPSVNAVMSEIQSVKNYLQENQVDVSWDGGGLKAAPAEMLSSYFAVIKSDVAELEKREEELLKYSKQEATLAKEVEMSFLKGGSLLANLERARARYDEVFQRLQEINLTSESSGFATDLLVSPMVAEKPVWPHPLIVGALGILAGGMLGLGLALLAELTDRTFRDPHDVEQAVGAAILAHIPKLEAPKQKKGAQESTSLISPMIATFHHPHGSAAETFRVLRTSVMFLTKKDRQQTLMITSPSPADGKSTMIANLAVSLAQAGRNVLLVDADLRRPTVAKTFGITAPVGLSDYLHGEAELSECCHASEQADLSICPDGAATSQPAELLQSDRLGMFLAEARKRFDIVLIDAPPLLAVADPAIIADVVDGCLLTVRIEKNNRTLIERAKAILADQDVVVDGVIVNSLESKRNAYGYSSYNYYGKKEYGYQAKYRRYYSTKEPGTKDPASHHRPSSPPQRATGPNGHGVNVHDANGHGPNGRAADRHGAAAEDQSTTIRLPNHDSTSASTKTTIPR